MFQAQCLRQMRTLFYSQQHRSNKKMRYAQESRCNLIFHFQPNIEGNEPETTEDNHRSDV